MEFAGHESEAELLGIFQVSILHNIVHLLFGAAGLAMARTARNAVAYLVGGGVIYLVLWIYCVVTDKTSEANFVPLIGADDWLHFVLGLAMIAWESSAAGRCGAQRRPGSVGDLQLFDVRRMPSRGVGPARGRRRTLRTSSTQIERSRRCVVSPSQKYGQHGQEMLDMDALTFHGLSDVRIDDASRIPASSNRRTQSSR